MSPGGFIYAIGVVGTSYVKIGSTRASVEARLKQLQIGQPLPLQIVATFPVEAQLSTIEKHIHTFLATEHTRGEWFDTDIDMPRLESLVLRALVAAAEASALPQPPHERTRPGALGERIAHVRKTRQWSQKELAKRATVHHVVLNRLENGHKAGVHAETIRLLAVALDCSMDYLMGLTDDPQPRKRRRQADKQGDFWPAAVA